MYLLINVTGHMQDSGDGEPTTQKAWEHIAIIVTSCRNKIKDRSDQR